MSEAEALACVERIRVGISSLRKDVLDLYERRGWKALGYASWLDCTRSLFGGTKSGLYRELSAAMIERAVEPDAPVGSIPERQLRALSKLPDEDRRPAWVEAKAGGKVTGDRVAEVVGRRLSPSKSPAGDFEPSPQMMRADEARALIEKAKAGIDQGIEALRAMGYPDIDVVPPQTGCPECSGSGEDADGGGLCSNCYGFGKVPLSDLDDE